MGTAVAGSHTHAQRSTTQNQRLRARGAATLAYGARSTRAAALSHGSRWRSLGSRCYSSRECRHTSRSRTWSGTSAAHTYSKTKRVEREEDRKGAGGQRNGKIGARLDELRREQRQGGETRGRAEKASWFFAGGLDLPPSLAGAEPALCPTSALGLVPAPAPALRMDNPLGRVAGRACLVQPVAGGAAVEARRAAWTLRHEHKPADRVWRRWRCPLAVARVECLALRHIRATARSAGGGAPDVRLACVIAVKERLRVTVAAGLLAKRGDVRRAGRYNMSTIVVCAEAAAGGLFGSNPRRAVPDRARRCQRRQQREHIGDHCVIFSKFSTAAVHAETARGPSTSVPGYQASVPHAG
eukprot:SAG11_NODE_1193_length_5551_cov_2.289252_3_plen_355_part_00